MDHPWAGMLKVGIVHPMAFPNCKTDEEVESSIRRIAEDDFFGAIEISHIENESLRKKVGEMLRTAHMDVIFAGQPPLLTGRLSLCSLDEEERRKAIGVCKKHIDEAYEVGATILAVESGKDVGEALRGKARENLIASLEELCAYAQEKGGENIVAISLENFDREIDKKSLIGPSEEAGAVAGRIKEKYSNFGLTIDLSHIPLLGEKIHEALIAVSDYLIHVHIGNCILDKAHPFYGDNHPPFGEKGGAVDVEEVRSFLEALVYIGYFRRSVPTRLPVVSFEVKPLPGQSSEIVIANAKRVFAEAWAKL